MLYCERHLEQAHKEDPSTDRSAKGEVRLLLQSYEHMEVDTEELLGEILRLPDRVHHPPVWQVQEHIQYWPNYADAFTSERLKATAQRLAPVSACPPTSPLAPASPLPSASPSRTAPPQPPPAPKANAPSTSATSGGNLAPPQMGRPEHSRTGVPDHRSPPRGRSISRLQFDSCLPSHLSTRRPTACSTAACFYRAFRLTSHVSSSPHTFRSPSSSPLIPSPHPLIPSPFPHTLFQPPSLVRPDTISS